MRTLSAGLVAMAITVSAVPSAEQSPVSPFTGTIVSGSGPDTRPVRRARVTLSGGGLPTPRIADTDTKGVYRIDRLPPGQYRIAVQKAGFVRREAEAVPGATLELTRGAAIQGVVSDAAGDPIPNAAVRALEPAVDGKPGRRVAQTRTDDLGRYRLHSLDAGDYVIEAATDQLFVQNQLLMPGERRAEITQAYYPAGETVDSAKPVRVAVGREVSAIDVRLSPAWPSMDPNVPPPPPRPDATGTARIEGRITDAVSGKPIGGARLLLVGIEGMSLTNWKRTDAQGRFEYTQLVARRYRLTVSADRFVSLEFGQKRPGETGMALEVTDGATVKADVALPRAGAVEGILYDEFGDPAPGLFVQAARKQFAAGRTRLMPVERRMSTAITDDRGHYRLGGLDPGEYYVAALSGAYAEQSETGGFAPTYYPGTPDSGAATPVAVPFGADATAPFALTPARTVAVSGTMVDANGQPVGRGTIWLMTPDRLQRADFNLARGGTGADGRFVLRNVPQGPYTLQGFGAPPPGGRGPLNLGAMPFGWTSVSVGDTDIDDVVLKVTNGTALRGRIVLEDPAVPAPRAEQIRVNTIPVEFDSAPVGGGPSPSTTNADFTFEVTNLSGLRRVFVSSGSPGWMLKRITRNGQDVTDAPLDFRTENVEDVEIQLTPRVTAVTGTVADEKGQPVTDCAVVIFSSDPSKWIDRSRFVGMVRPNQQGMFTARGLPPDQYLAIALPNVVFTEWTDPAFLQQLRPGATGFVLSEGETKTLTLSLKKHP
jgi:protocatechuate 3,4-dioxygenase beta subunit